MRLLCEALVCGDNADVAQLVEHNLAKVGVAGSNPVVRSELWLTLLGGPLGLRPSF